LVGFQSLFSWTMCATLNFKYSPAQIGEIKREVRYQQFLLDELINRRMKKSRVAYIALAEYRVLRKYAVEIEGVEPSTNDKEQNDLTIVETLRRFERERAALPAMLTADRQMADLCEAEGIEHIHFTLPHAVEADFCSHSSMLKAGIQPRNCFWRDKAEQRCRVW